MKTKPITLRFEQEQLDLLMSKEGFSTPGKALNWLLARYYWGHQLSGGVALPADYVEVGDVRIAGSGKPVADLPRRRQVVAPVLPEVPKIAQYDAYLADFKDARSAKKIERIDSEVQRDAQLSGRQKLALHMVGQEISKKFDA
jgi:hypothetical protein